MIVDIQNLEKENSLYDCILENITNGNSNDIELNNKDQILLKNIKSKILKSLSTEIYKNILDISKYIISKNFSTKIAFIDMDNSFIEENNYINILQILFKLNWLGKIDFSVNITSNEKYNLYVMKNRESIGLTSFTKDTLLYLIEDNVLLKI